MTARTDNAILSSTGRPASAGLTLIELMIVISLIAILSAIIVPQLTPSAYDQLEAAAYMLAADLDYGRNLAVTNDSKYRFNFDSKENRYFLEHSGTNPLLDDLPDSSLRRTDDKSTQQTTDFDDIPHIGPAVVIITVLRMTGSPIAVTDLEFGPLGETTRTEPTVIWLGWGNTQDRRYLSLRVDPITGLASIDQYQSVSP